jgi:hypothetical protein
MSRRISLETGGLLKHLGREVRGDHRVKYGLPTGAHNQALNEISKGPYPRRGISRSGVNDPEAFLNSPRHLCLRGPAFEQACEVSDRLRNSNVR